MASFVYNASEITTWMGYSFKTKGKKNQSNAFKIRTTFLNFKMQIIRLAQGQWSFMPTH